MLARTSHVCDRSMTFTVSYGAYLPNTIDRGARVSLVKWFGKQLGLACL